MLDSQKAKRRVWWPSMERIDAKMPCIAGSKECNLPDLLNELILGQRALLELDLVALAL